MKEDEPVVVVAFIPDVEGWDQKKGRYALTFFGKHDGGGVETYPANAIPTHQPEVEIPVLPELEALTYCFKNMPKPAAIPAAQLSDQLKRLLGFD